MAWLGKERGLSFDNYAVIRERMEPLVGDPSIYEMAAAYLFHLFKNHPFLDGNKRTALATCLAFLWLNGLEIVADPDELVALVLGVANGGLSKADVAVYLAKTAHPL